ncbi:sigma factor [Nocardia fluminea]|uniref:sigma factor n=1 Tax=Nocardia fluminea TaxID=134984 RepID=UPI00343CAAE5
MGTARAKGAARADRGRPVTTGRLPTRLPRPPLRRLARQLSRRSVFDDLEQTARVGLVLAVDRFDVTRGGSFLSDAIPTIMGGVRRQFRDRTWAVHVP